MTMDKWAITLLKCRMASQIKELLFKMSCLYDCTILSAIPGFECKVCSFDCKLSHRSMHMQFTSFRNSAILVKLVQGGHSQMINSIWIQPNKGTERWMTPDSRRMQREFTHVMLTSTTGNRTGVGTTATVVPTIVLVEEGWAW